MEDLTEHMTVHMAFLMDKLAKAYHAQNFDGYDKLKKQIHELRSVMNDYDRVISEHRKLKTLEGSQL